MPWQKLPESEVHRRRLSEARRYAFYWGAAILATGFARLFLPNPWRQKSKDWETISWSEFVADFPGLLVITVLVALGVYLYKFRRPRHRVRICIQCGAVANNGARQCQCDGPVDYLEYYEFVDPD